MALSRRCCSSVLKLEDLSAASAPIIIRPSTSTSRLEDLSAASTPIIISPSTLTSRLEDLSAASTPVISPGSSVQPAAVTAGGQQVPAVPCEVRVNAPPQSLKYTAITSYRLRLKISEPWQLWLAKAEMLPVYELNRIKLLRPFMLEWVLATHRQTVDTAKWAHKTFVFFIC